MTMQRRRFIAAATGTAAGLMLGPSWQHRASAADSSKQMRLGLVTYNWGKDWDVPTLIRNCEATGFAGVELRSTHKHGVEITIDRKRRREVASQFADSNVELVGLGSACEYHSTDPAVLKKNIDETKAFVRLCHDVGGTGVKVRPNGIPKDVPIEKTLEQIGKSLREVATFGADFGVAIRLEVHGRDGSAALPNIHRMMQIADHPNAVVCWNCNPSDLDGEGLQSNFDLVKKKIGTIHIHDLRSTSYPWKELFGLLKAARFSGWTLLEEGTMPRDIVAAMHENRAIWQQLTAR
ncbi:MAG: sugar phosphate isomerase/epimerase [Planctomycetota bacterium]|nr:sugar phosphate isomerase/epimerase [Planctomycetota bacterium]MDA1166161.1 sugar phosphate isomerase/epimerase [Planctomycetota bacterium]